MEQILLPKDWHKASSEVNTSKWTTQWFTSCKRATHISTPRDQNQSKTSWFDIALPTKKHARYGLITIHNFFRKLPKICDMKCSIHSLPDNITPMKSPEAPRNATNPMFGGNQNSLGQLEDPGVQFRRAPNGLWITVHPALLICTSQCIG